MNLMEKVDNIEFEAFLNPYANITKKFDYLNNDKEIRLVYLIILIVYSILGISSLVT